MSNIRPSTPNIAIHTDDLSSESFVLPSTRTRGRLALKDISNKGNEKLQDNLSAEDKLGPLPEKLVKNTKRNKIPNNRQNPPISHSQSQFHPSLSSSSSSQSHYQKPSQFVSSFSYSPSDVRDSVSLSSLSSSRSPSFATLELAQILASKPAATKYIQGKVN